MVISVCGVVPDTTRLTLVPCAVFAVVPQPLYANTAELVSAPKEDCTTPTPEPEPETPTTPTNFSPPKVSIACTVTYVQLHWPAPSVVLAVVSVVLASVVLVIAICGTNNL